MSYQSLKALGTREIDMKIICQLGIVIPINILCFMDVLLSTVLVTAVNACYCGRNNEVTVAAMWGRKQFEFNGLQTWCLLTVNRLYTLKSLKILAVGLYSSWEGRSNPASGWLEFSDIVKIVTFLFYRLCHIGMRLVLKLHRVLIHICHILCRWFGICTIHVNSAVGKASGNVAFAGSISFKLLLSAQQFVVVTFLSWECKEVLVSCRLFLCYLQVKCNV
jgi:hypothetical protein